ncbi:MAG: peptidoglycan bridge formation glycyltransferase FemA/FemB family protein [Paludibacteraceae bacterium]|nr:peptidoglycan bridge formation glycyltransferase FemA/FemB family protein [Paludibacteraceae bacterium]
MPNCKILKYYEIDKVAWQMLIKQSSYATWFQTPEAYNFYESVHNEMTPFAYGVERRGELCAVCVGYITKEKNIIKQFFTRRAIIIGGPVIADNAEEQDVEQLLRAMIVELTSQAIYIETRNFNDYSKWNNVFEECGFSYQPHLNVQVTCDAAHTMSEQRRRQVKKAICNGATISEAQSEQEIRYWYKILHRLYREKVRTPLFTEKFFLEFYRKGFGKYLLVKYEDKVIGGMMCPVLEGKAIYEWYVCGLDEEYREQYPSVMATYAAIEYAKEKHIPLFDFMGAGKPDEPYGVRDFKMEFGGEQVEYGRFLCIRKPMLYAIGKLGVKWLKRCRV